MENSLLELWTELVFDERTFGGKGLSFTKDPIFLESLETGSIHGIWTTATDESLKSVLSRINKLLNEPKTRPKGLTLLDSFLSGIPQSRFVAVQDGITSALHMIVKSLDLELTQKFFVNFIPKCRKLPEINQVMTSLVVPKILSYFCHEAKEQLPSSEELILLKTCLEYYHGPCGNSRGQLEKILVPFLDQSNFSELKPLYQVIPLLSNAGGGGNKGDRHSQDWKCMVTKVMKELYSSTAQLYGDSSPLIENENPFHVNEAELGMAPIREMNVFLKMIKLKRRVVNLASLLGCYLSDPFPAPKPVPQRSILNLLSSMMVINPVDLMKRTTGSLPKESMFLTNILPAVHKSGLQLLDDLMLCVGTNLMTEGGRMEQLILQEFKWMSEAPKAYEELRICLYKTSFLWMKLTRGIVTNEKISKLWSDQIQNDTSIEKDDVQLNLGSNVRSGKKGSFKAASKGNFISTSLSTTSPETILCKSSELCKAALVLLKLVIPSMDPTSHLGMYQHLLKAVSTFSHSSIFPSPYDDFRCRIKSYEGLVAMALNPHPEAPISLGMLLNTLKQSSLQDPVSEVNVASHQMITVLEKLIHPICPTLNFPFISKSIASQNYVEPSEDNTVDVEHELHIDQDQYKAPVETSETFCQTDETGPSSVSSSVSVPHSSSVPKSDLEEIKSLINGKFEALKKMFLTERQVEYHSLNGQSENQETLNVNVTKGFQNGNEKNSRSKSPESVSEECYLSACESESTTFGGKPLESSTPFSRNEDGVTTNGTSKRKIISFSPSLLTEDEDSVSEIMVKRTKGESSQSDDTTTTVDEGEQSNLEEMIKDFVAD